MTWKDRMYAGIGEYLRSKDMDAIKVMYLDEDVSVRGPYGCDTCGPEYDTEFNVTISYINSAGKTEHYYYDGSFVDFLNNIT